MQPPRQSRRLLGRRIRQGQNHSHPREAGIVWVDNIDRSQDRIALRMVEEAERLGQITPGKTILVEPSA